MKVVLFCGGQGLRLRDHSETLPKPMVTVGYRPILWHVMRYYAHFGHTEFILCLGYKADVIKNYFLDYRETLSNDFVLSGEDGTVELIHRDISDWRITFVDTGLSANVGQRLRAVRKHVGNEHVPGQLRGRAYGRALGRSGSRSSWRGTQSPRSCASGPRVIRSTSCGWANRIWSARSTMWARPTSGSTAATSSCARRSSTSSALGRNSSSSRSRA